MESLTETLHYFHNVQINTTELQTFKHDNYYQKHQFSSIKKTSLEEKYNNIIRK